MRKKRLPALLLTVFVVAFFMSANLLALDDASSLECDGGTVSPGDAQASVRDKCGDPQKVTRVDADSPVVWFYNFGSSEFVYYVTFTNGIVERIQMGGYGN